MDEKKVLKVFTRALKEFGCYRQFIKNARTLPRYFKDYDDGDKSVEHLVHLEVERCKNNTSIESPTPFYCKNPLDNIINDAFTWCTTEEGHSYWSEKSEAIRIVGSEIFVNGRKYNFIH